MLRAWGGDESENWLEAWAGTDRLDGTAEGSVVCRCQASAHTGWSLLASFQALEKMSRSSLALCAVCSHLGRI